jgi:hypothetical protein
MHACMASNSILKNHWVSQLIYSFSVYAGKVLFGRSQIHQVAEKRRVKIEEFCRVSYIFSLQRRNVTIIDCYQLYSRLASMIFIWRYVPSIPTHHSDKLCWYYGYMYICQILSAALKLYFGASLSKPHIINMVNRVIVMSEAGSSVHC